MSAGFRAIAAGAGKVPELAPPFIGGLSHRLAIGAGRPFANSILQGAVEGGTAAMLAIGEVELARVLASEYERLGENAGNISQSMALGFLLGGSFEAARGGLRSRRAGSPVEVSPVVDPGVRPVEESLENLTDLAKDLEPPPPGAKEIPTVEHVVGKIPKNLENPWLARRSSVKFLSRTFAVPARRPAPS